MHRQWEKEFFSVAREVTLVTTYCRQTLLRHSDFHTGWALNPASTGEACVIPLPVWLILMPDRGGDVELLKYVVAQNV